MVMMSREEIIEIEQYCTEHNVGKKPRLIELGIPFWDFYRSSRKYQQKDERNATEVSADNFIQHSTSPLGPPTTSNVKAGFYILDLTVQILQKKHSRYRNFP